MSVTRPWIGMLVGAMLASALSASAIAQEGPLRVRNGLPAAQLFGLPRALGGEVVRASELTLNSEAANSFTSDVDGTEFAFFDGETTTFTLGYRRPLGDRFEWGVEVPYVIHRGGEFDRLIDEFHDAFGLPQGGRDNAQRNKIDYVIRSDGITYADFQDSQEAWGDVRVSGGYQWLNEGDRSLAIRGLIKLPTGDEDKLTGSGAGDAAVWVDYTDRRLLARLGLELTLAGGLMIMDEGDVVPDEQNDAAVFGHLGLGWQFSQRWSIRAQLDGHSELISTGLDQTSGAALQGSVGFRFRATDRYWTDLALSEDLVSDSSPDVVFQLLLGASF